MPHQHCSVLLLPQCNLHLEYDPTTHYWNRKPHSFSSSNNEPPLHNTQSPKLPVKQTNKQVITNKQTYIQPNACTQEALQTPALAQVWAVWSKQPETLYIMNFRIYPGLPCMEARLRSQQRALRIRESWTPPWDSSQPQLPVSSAGHSIRRKPHSCLKLLVCSSYRY